MTEYNFDKTKGQSAIEYLMTYGWMLLVVAIVGGAIFATVQGQCTQTTSGYSGGDVLVENFGLDGDGNIQMEIRNGGSDTLTVQSVTIDNDGELVNDDETSLSEVDVGVGNAETIRIGNADEDAEWMQSSDGCNDFDLVFEYEIGELTNQQTSGSLTDSIEFE